MSEMLTPFFDSRHTKAGGKSTPQICRSRIFVPASECARVVPMYPSQSAMSHLHSSGQSMYVATFLPKHVITTCFADYVTSTSGAIRLAFDLLPWPQVICLSGLSLVVSALFRWPCNISIHLSPRSVTASPAFLFFRLPGLSLVCPCLLAMKHFYSFVSQVRYCWCPPFSVGHVDFLFICFPGLSLLVSALFRWRRNSSIHLFSRSVTAGVRPFPLAMQHFDSFVSRVCDCTLEQVHL